MEFLLLIEDAAGELPRADVGVEEMGKFARELADLGVLKSANGPLRPVAEGVRVRIEGGALLVTDGPFAEAREVVGGYFVVEAPDRAAASELAKRCPYTRAGRVDVRATQHWRRSEPTVGAQFLLLYLRPPLEDGPDEPRFRAMVAHTEELRRRNVHLEGARLPPEVPPARVESRGGRTLVSDGPFAESKEVLGGYALIQAPSRTAAIEIAAQIPHARWGAIEVREVGRR
jgi:hypothetical protein